MKNFYTSLAVDDGDLDILLDAMELLTERFGHDDEDGDFPRLIDAIRSTQMRARRERRAEHQNNLARRDALDAAADAVASARLAGTDEYRAATAALTERGFLPTEPLVRCALDRASGQIERATRIAAET